MLSSGDGYGSGIGSVLQLASHPTVGIDRRRLDRVRSNVVEELRVGEGGRLGPPHRGTQQQHDGESIPRNISQFRQDGGGGGAGPVVRRSCPGSGRRAGFVRCCTRPHPRLRVNRSRDGHSNRCPRLSVVRSCPHGRCATRAPSGGMARCTVSGTIVGCGRPVRTVRRAVEPADRTGLHRDGSGSFREPAWLDVGCGTGALSSAIIRTAAPAEVRGSKIRLRGSSQPPTL